MGKEGKTERQGELAGSWSCLQKAVSRGVGEGREVRSCASCHNPSCLSDLELETFFFLTVPQLHEATPGGLVRDTAHSSAQGPGFALPSEN